MSSVGAPVSMDKMLYLSERMFYQEGTTDAGYLDQCARLRNQLGGISQVHYINTYGKRRRPQSVRHSNGYWAACAVNLELAQAWFLRTRLARLTTAIAS